MNVDDSDASSSSLNSMTDYIESEIKPDLAFWSGNVATDSYQSNKSNQSLQSNKVLTAFKRKVGHQVNLLIPKPNDSGFSSIPLPTDLFSNPLHLISIDT